jgi:hypothetical protein
LTPPPDEVRTRSWLKAAVLAYAAAFALYFFAPAAAAAVLKYVTAIGGILLATVVREVAPKDWKWFRVVAIALPLVAVAVIQGFEDRRAKQQRAADQAKELRERSRSLEAKLREQLVPDPRDAIEAIRNAHLGFQAKSEVLSLRASLETSTPEAERLRRLARAYGAAADEFEKEISPRYARLLALERKETAAFDARLAEVAQRLTGMAARHELAGLYNHAGMLAEAMSRGDQALAYFYRAVVLESDHIPAYESLGYALWLFNEDAHGALRLAERGLRQVAAQRAGIADPKRVQRYAAHLAAMEQRLKLQYAYFSAILYVNEQQARQYASDELKRAPDDAEIQDAMGYVLLRFARSADEVKRAADLFRAAIANPQAERLTPRLATAHLHQAHEALARF